MTANLRRVQVGGNAEGSAHRCGASTGEKVIRSALYGMASLFLLWGIYAVWKFGWRDLYADPWRLYRQFLTRPFPDSVLFLDNGHRPVMPNLLRVAELHWLAGNQQLQWSVGLVLSVITVLLGWRILHRDTKLQPTHRAACVLAVAMAVFWLANSRMLMHPNESVHTYLVTTMMIVIASLGWRLHSLADLDDHRLAVIGCAACGVVATFSFGPGVALLPALAIAWLVARVRLGIVSLLLGIMLVMLAVYFALPGGEGVSGSLSVRPFDNLRLAAQWLASPITTLLLPFLDPNLSSALPGENLRALALWAATGYVAHLGKVQQGVWPQALLGLAGMAILAAQSIDRRRRGAITATEFAGLVLAWFGLGVAGVVAISRLDYFEVHRDQVYANRYLPWPCLFWAGLALLALGKQRAGTHAASPPATRRTVVAVIAIVAVGALASNGFWMGWARDTQTLARHQASAVLADLYSTTLVQGETVPAELNAGLPLVRAAKVAMFAHPVAGRMGARLENALPAVFPVAAPIAASAYVSDGGTAAMEFTGSLPPGYPRLATDYWLVTDLDRRVIGYAHPEPLASRERLAGFILADVPRSAVLAFPWIDGAGPGTGVTLHIGPR